MSFSTPNEIKQLAETMFSRRDALEQSRATTSRINEYQDQWQKQKSFYEDSMKGFPKWNEEELTRIYGLSPAWIRDQHFNGSSGEAIPRNQYGEPLYDEQCQACREHEEERRECECCGQNYGYIRIHFYAPDFNKPVNITDDPLMNTMNTKQRKEEQHHWCGEQKEFLITLLMTMI